MATYSWPPSLPKYPEKGFSETGGVLVLRTPMDAGPAKLRYRGKAPSKLNVTYFMTTDQVTALETFVYDILKGVRRFDILHPRKPGVLVEARIVPNGDTYFTVNYAAPGHWRVQLTLEVLP